MNAASRRQSVHWPSIRMVNGAALINIRFAWNLAWIQGFASPNETIHMRIDHDRPTGRIRMVALI